MTRNWQQHVDALRAEIARRDAVIDAARWLNEMVQHREPHDSSDDPCIRNHGSIWHQLDDALSALERQVGE